MAWVVWLDTWSQSLSSSSTRSLLTFRGEGSETLDRSSLTLVLAFAFLDGDQDPEDDLPRLRLSYKEPLVLGKAVVEALGPGDAVDTVILCGGLRL